MIMYQFSTN